jgi:uncharacterized protein YkwD
VHLSPAPNAQAHVWNTPTSVLDGSWPYFAGPAFSPALAKSDVIQISGAPGYSYTIDFGGAQITDPILELGSLGSRIDFPKGTRLTRLSGEGGFTVNTSSCVTGSCVSGTPSSTIGTSGNSDASGTIQLTGSYSSITFTTTPNYSGPEDGILVQLVTQAVTQPPDPPVCVASDYDKTVDQLTQTAAENAGFCLVNEQRTAYGLAPYTRNTILDQAARAHAQASADIKWWTLPPNKNDWHTNPQTGSTPVSRIKGAGYCPSGTYSVGENAWPGFGPGQPTPRNAVTAWMNSHEGHREAILSTTYKETGLGVVADTPVKGVTDKPAGTFIETFGSCT